MEEEKVSYQEAEIVNEKKFEHAQAKRRSGKPYQIKELKLYAAGVILPLGILMAFCSVMLVQSVLALIQVIQKNPDGIGYYLPIIAGCSLISLVLSITLFSMNLMIVIKFMSPRFYRRITRSNIILISFLLVFLFGALLCMAATYDEILLILLMFIVAFGSLISAMSIHLLTIKEIKEHIIQ